MKCHELGKGHPDYKRPRGNENTFTLNHYAGKVEYYADGPDPSTDAGGFLYKNRDTLAVDVVGTLRLASNDLVNGLFGGEGGGAGGTKKKRGRADMRKSIKHARASQGKTQKVTLASTFKKSLLALKENLLSSQPHFIRTIKPNHNKLPHDFDARIAANDGEDGLVYRQLSYTGMLETIRIRKQGYPSRPKFKDFVYRYKVLGFPCRADVKGSAQSCRQILEKAGVDSYQVGKTKVFLKDKHAGELNQKIVGADLGTIIPRESQTLGHAGRINVYFGNAAARCTHA
jgi:myosin-3